MTDQTAVPMPSLESIVRRDRDKLIGEVVRLTAEVESLRGAMANIAADLDSKPDQETVAKMAINIRLFLGEQTGDKR